MVIRSMCLCLQYDIDLLVQRLGDGGVADEALATLRST
jgi:hypothetical protein